MLRINEICVKKEEKSRVAFSNVQESIEHVMQKNASAINYKIVEEEHQLKVMLDKPISLQTANKILLSFDNKRMKLMKVSLERKMIGEVFAKGHMEIIVS